MMMSRILLTIFAATISITSFSQALSLRDDFDSNRLGWNEFVGKHRTAVINDGVLHLETDKEKGIAISSCYAPVDPKAPFEIKAKLIKTKINDEEQGIGLVFNYLDDDNYDVFILSKDLIYYKRWRDGKRVGFRYGDLKIDKRQKDHELNLKSGFDKIEFSVNNVKALEIRNAPLQYTGFGLFVWTDDDTQAADIDYIEIKQ